MSAATASPPAPPDPRELLRSRQYLVLLVFGAIVGVVVSFAAYFFLKFIGNSQTWVYQTLPKDLGFDSEPTWWPVPVLAVGGVLVACAISYLPGRGGHSPADGFKPAGLIQPIWLFGIALAAYFTLTSGAVLGPEAPLIALGAGIGVFLLRAVRHDAPDQAALLIGAAGSFAAISALFGGPLPALFLLMEVAGVGGPMLGVMLVPGMLAAGLGSLIYVGLDNLTGYGTFSLAVPDIPPIGTPTGAEILWAVAIGVLGSILANVIRRIALEVRPLVERRMVLLMPVVGAAVGVLAVIFGKVSGHPSSEMLFSGQSTLPALVQDPAAWTVGALLLIVACKSLAYSLSLSSFRGGPVFPSMFIGAALGLLLAHLPGLNSTGGAAMGIGAMTASMLGLPLSAVMLVAVFMSSVGLALMPLVIVAVVVSYVVNAHISDFAIPPSQRPKQESSPS